MKKIIFILFYLISIASGQIITGSSLSKILKGYVTQSLFTSTINGLILGGGGVTLSQVQAIIHDSLLNKANKSITLSGLYSITGGGDLSANRTFSLSGDVSAPGNNYFYGTNSGGTKGFYLQTNINHNTLTNYVSAQHVDHTAVAISGGTSLSGGGNIDASRTITLLNDATSPGNNYYYGTNSGGTKGFYVLSSSGEANDGANVGISGTGWYKNKSGVTLNFRNAVAASTKLTINLNDVNNILEFDVVPANIDHNGLLNYSANRHIDHTTISISGGTSLTGGGTIDANRTITFQNDAASPGNSYYYGTNAGGTKGYYALPTGGGGDFNSNLFITPIFATANLTGTLSCTTNKTFFLYVGRTSRAFSQIDIEFRVTTLAATITWAEVGIFKGNVPARGGTASLSRLGFANVAAVVNTTGQKNVTITLTTNAVAGDNLWLAWGNQATTVMVLRAQSIADDLQSGCYQGMTSTRISTCAIPVTTTIESATALPAWILGRSL